GPIQVSRPSPLGLLRAGPSSSPSMVGKKAPIAASSSVPSVRGAILPRQSTSLGEPFLGVLVFTRRTPVPPAQPSTRAPADHAAAPARPGRGAGRADPRRARGEGLPRRAGTERALRLRAERRTDRQRDVADEQSLLRQAGRSRENVGHRI